MAWEQYGTVFENYEDDDVEPSSTSDDDEKANVLNRNDVVLNGEEDEELLLEEDLNNPSSLPQPTVAAVSSASILPVPLAVPSSSVVTVAAVPTDESPPDFKRQRIDSTVTEKKPPTPLQFDDSRRLFQRLWTDEDEIELLQGFLDYTASKTNSNSSSSSSHHHHYDTALFYDLIKSKLQLDFNKNQLVEKLRRLKKKYRNVVNKMSSGKDFNFKSLHDQATFDISRKIWSNSVCKVEENVLDDYENHNNININNSNINPIVESGEKKNFTDKSSATKKRSTNKGGKIMDGFVIANDYNFTNRSNNDIGNVEGFGGGCGGGGNVTGLVEEAVKSCLTPLCKDLLGSVTGGGRGISGFVLNAMPLSFGGSLNFGGGGGGGSNGELMMDERWRKQQILELEVYSKRLELVQDEIKAALVELRSMSG